MIRRFRAGSRPHIRPPTTIQRRFPARERGIVRKQQFRASWLQTEALRGPRRAGSPVRPAPSSSVVGPPCGIAHPWRDRIVQQTLGHASLATTSRYTHARKHLEPLDPAGLSGHRMRFESDFTAPSTYSTPVIWPIPTNIRRWARLEKLFVQSPDLASVPPQSPLDGSGIPKNLDCRCLTTKYAGRQTAEQQRFALPQQPDQVNPYTGLLFRGLRGAVRAPVPRSPDALGKLRLATFLHPQEFREFRRQPPDLLVGATRTATSHIPVNPIPPRPATLRLPCRRS